MLSRIRSELARASKWQPNLLIYTFLSRWGVEFTPTALPDGVERGRPKRCFVNAAELVLGTRNHAGYAYAEGLVLTRSMMLVEHAWCVKGGFAIEPTLKSVNECEYLGIVVPDKLLMRHQSEYRSFGVLRYEHGQKFMKRWDDAQGDIGRLLERYK